MKAVGLKLELELSGYDLRIRLQPPILSWWERRRLDDPRCARSTPNEPEKAIGLKLELEVSGYDLRLRSELVREETA